MSDVDNITSHLKEYVQSYQPECLRALGILCLNKALERRPSWGNSPTTATDHGASILDNGGHHDDQGDNVDLSLQSEMEISNEDSATVPTSDLCDTVQQVTRNIARLTKMNHLEAMKQDFDRKFHWLNATITVHSRKDGNDRDQGYFQMTFEDKTSEITPSHIRGEAYEILSVLAFKCRGEIPIHLQNYYVQDSDGDKNEEFQGSVTCTVKNVFLSEKQFAHQGLRWRDNREKPENYFDDLKSYIISHEGSEEGADALVEILERNVEKDLGFDILVELEEKANEGEAIRHFMIAQCKYRSWEEIEIDMASYVGKYYNIVHLFDKINSMCSKTFLCPFFWISTQLQPDGMNYFDSLQKSGRIVFYGNTAMQYDNQVCSLIPNIRHETGKWIEHAQKEHLEELTLLAKPPREPRDYQEEAINSVLKFCEEVQQKPKEKFASIIMATGSGKTLTSFHSATRAEKKFLTLTAPMNTEDKTESGRENRKASLHLSPMIRLVMQNAHEWLSEEIAVALDAVRNHKGKEKPNVQLPIYYCVCSLKDSSSSALHGCTSIRIITTKRLYGVVKHHQDKGTLHLCRFFTTYQAGRSLWMQVRKINMEIYHKNPTFPFFGVTIRDEAHSAVGRGSKTYSASLYVPTDLALSFTASAKYEFDNVKSIFPDIYEKKSETCELSGYEESHNFLSVEKERLFPQIDWKLLNQLSVNGVQDSRKQWDPQDLLSEELLFEKEDVETKNITFDWTYFQEKANTEGKTIVVFFVDNTPCNIQIDNKKVYNIEFDEHDRPKYFGAVSPAVPGRPIELDVNHETQCFGVDKDLTSIFKPFGTTRGFSMHDMTGIGEDNRIGRIIHTLSYAKCMSRHCLAPPRLITLEKRAIEKEEYRKLGIENTDFLDEVFGKQGNSVKSPSLVKWRLTINGQILEASAHQFRSMKLLLDCFFDEKLKQLKQVLVFCSKTEESRLCRRIFEALLTKHFQEEERKKFYLDVIYTSDAKANDDDESDMSYEEQQYKLAKFSQAEKSVLFNVKLIGIGVDIPSIDAALIVHPSKSPSSITQKDGRALRTDSRNLDKMASIIVPCWCPFDTEGAEPEHSLAFTMRTVTRVDANDDQIDSVAQPNSTPVRRPQSGEMSTPREVPGEILQWSPPINNSFEEEYFLQVRVLKAMLDDDIEMITSIFDGSRSLDARKDKKEDKLSTAETLIKSIIGDSKDSRHIPVFDEKLSDFILSVWKPNVQEDLKSELPYRPPRKMTPKEAHIQKFKVLCIVAAVAVLEIGTDGNGKSRLHTDARPSLQSRIWYKSCKPFDPEKRICLNHIGSHSDDIPWQSMQFENFEAFKACLYSDSSNFLLLENLRIGAVNLFKHFNDNREEWKKFVNEYLTCLVQEHAYENFMEAFAAVNEVSKTQVSGKQWHDHCGFTEQQFISAMMDEIEQVIIDGFKFCRGKSTNGKRVARNEDSMATDVPCESVGAAGNSTVQKKRRRIPGEPSRSNVGKKLSFEDNEGHVSTGITAAASALEHATFGNPNDGQIEVESQPPNEI